MQNNDIGKEPGPATAPHPPEATQARGTFDLRSSVHKKPKNLKLWGVAAIVGVALIAGLFTIWAVAIKTMNEGSANIDESTVQADPMLQNVGGNDDAMRIARQAKARKLAEEEEQQRKKDLQVKSSAEPTSKPAQTAQATAPAPARSSGQAPSAPAEITPEQRKLGGGVYVKTNTAPVSSYGESTNGARSSGQNGGSGGDVDLLSDSGGGSGSSRNRGSLSNLSGTNFKPSKAVLAPDGKYLLRHNTYARCALYTEIVTDQPGLVECRLTEPLYSADGSTVIAEAGAALNGEQKVEIRPGQTRVFTSWTELETSSGVAGVPGVRARLDSLGAGQMGASGTQAWIDNHYMERYGGAVALSGFQDVLAAASNSTQRNGSGYTVNNSEQNVENMASKALDANININPTGYLLPGTILTVIIARDIDFSSVYENR